MKLKALTLAMLSFGFCGTSIAHSEFTSLEDDFFDDFYGSEEMVEIATGIKTQIFKAPAIATVITSEQIHQMGATDIDDILETVPGLHVSRSANSYLPLYTFRGVHSTYNPQVLMLINGIPITNNFLGNRNQNWLGMPVEAIARVEVIRGPGSAIFGSDAFAGVINIISKSADDINDNQFAIRAGSNNTQDAWVNVASVTDSYKFALNLEYHKTDGDDSIIEADAQTRLDGIFGTDVSHAPGSVSLGAESYDIRAELEFDQFVIRAGMQKRTNGGLGAGLGQALDPKANKASDRYNLDINYRQQVNPNLNIDYQLSYFETSQEIKNNYWIYPEGAQLGSTSYPNGFIGNPEVWERHYRANATAQYDGLENHIVRVGVGFHRGDMYQTKESKNFGLGPDGQPLPEGSPVVDVSDTPYMFLRENDRDNTYAFIQDVWKVANDWEVTAGVRIDDYSDFGSTVNPRLALVWSTSLNLSTKILYGKAFRAPSFAELGNINNPVSLGNPDLQPEEMETVELAFDYHPRDDFGAIISFYRYQWSDIIQFIPDPGKSTNTAQNFGEQVGYGAEFELQWQLSEKLRLAGNYAYVSAENEQTNKDVAYVPSDQLYLQLDWKINEDLRFHIRNNWVMGRERANLDLRENIDDYSLADATLRWQPKGSDWQLSLIAKNLFDVDAREPSASSGERVNIPNDLPLAGFSALVEFRYQF